MGHGKRMEDFKGSFVLTRKLCVRDKSTVS